MAVKTKLNKKKGTKQKQKQKQQQSVIVKIDQSKRVIQRERQPKQPIIQQPPPMNIMITPPPQLSINDAMKQQQPRMTSQQEQQIRQPLTQPMTQQTLQPSRVIQPNTVDFVEDTPVFVKGDIDSSDKIPTHITTGKEFIDHSREPIKLREQEFPHQTLLSDSSSSSSSAGAGDIVSQTTANPVEWQNKKTNITKAIRAEFIRSSFNTEAQIEAMRQQVTDRQFRALTSLKERGEDNLAEFDKRLIRMVIVRQMQEEQ